MKNKLLYAVLFFIGLSQAVFAQRARNVFSPQTAIAWLGIDFSQARFIGDYKKFRTEADALRLMEALNELMIIEKTKYDVRKMLRKQNVYLKLDVTIDHNKTINIGALLADSLKSHDHLVIDNIKEIVSQYSFKGNTGIGLMYNVETFNKKKSEALIWVTFINMDTKDVIFSERLGQEPGGFGLRNFWAGAIDDMMSRVRRKKIKEWELKYLNK